jgi:AbrB family looped-hinge helix DNA binding protein
MYENISSIGERGQITIPKLIRLKQNIKSKDRMLITVNKEYIILKKIDSKEDIKQKMIKGYKELAKKSLELENEFKNTSKEANDIIEEY